MGAWTLYGLGTENHELPGFITINVGGAQNYGSRFLPAAFQRTAVGAGGKRPGSGIASLSNPRVESELQRKPLDLLQDLNRQGVEKDKVNPELEVVIESFELAFRIEVVAPKVMDLNDESSKTLAYGIEEKGTADEQQLRPVMPTGRPVRRSRRAVRRALHGRLGPAQGLEEQADLERPGDRQAGRGLAGRPEATRAAEGHAGRLGRRLRPDTGRPPNLVRSVIDRAERVVERSQRKRK
jgi:hypothetical protein